MEGGQESRGDGLDVSVKNLTDVDTLCEEIDVVDDCVA